MDLAYLNSNIYYLLDPYSDAFNKWSFSGVETLVLVAVIDYEISVFEGGIINAPLTLKHLYTSLECHNATIKSAINRLLENDFLLWDGPSLRLIPGALDRASSIYPSLDKVARANWLQYKRVSKALLDPTLKDRRIKKLRYWEKLTLMALTLHHQSYHLPRPDISCWARKLTITPRALIKALLTLSTELGFLFSTGEQIVLPYTAGKIDRPIVLNPAHPLFDGSTAFYIHQQLYYSTWHDPNHLLIPAGHPKPASHVIPTHQSPTSEFSGFANDNNFVFSINRDPDFKGQARTNTLLAAHIAAHQLAIQTLIEHWDHIANSSLPILFDALQQHPLFKELENQSSDARYYFLSELLLTAQEALRLLAAILQEVIHSGSLNLKEVQLIHHHPGLVLKRQLHSSATLETFTALALKSNNPALSMYKTQLPSDIEDALDKSSNQLKLMLKGRWVVPRKFYPQLPYFAHAFTSEIQSLSVIRAPEYKHNDYKTQLPTSWLEAIAVTQE